MSSPCHQMGRLGRQDAYGLQHGDPLIFLQEPWCWGPVTIGTGLSKDDLAASKLAAMWSVSWGGHASSCGDLSVPQPLLSPIPGCHGQQLSCTCWEGAAALGHAS